MRGAVEMGFKISMFYSFYKKTFKTFKSTIFYIGFQGFF